MDQYGIIGYPLHVTQSPAYFTAKFARENVDAIYRKYPLKNVAEFPILLEGDSPFKGFNVTIPHKESILHHIDLLHEDAAHIGAVNCIGVDKKGKTHGYNTDWIAFQKSLSPYLKAHHNKALVLGTGGAAKAVTYALKKMGIAFTMVSRTGGNDRLRYLDLTAEFVAAHPLLIHTTPLGMAPFEASFPDLPYEGIGPDHLVYDLIYEPEKTVFLALCESHAATIINGQDMFEKQAEASWEIWQSEYLR